MSKRNRNTSSSDDSVFSEDEAQLEQRADERDAQQEQKNEQPPEEGTDPHEEPPKDGPLAPSREPTIADPQRDAEFPALEPETAPEALRAAPVGDASDERDSWGEQPSVADIEKAERIALRTTDPRSVGLYSGGVLVTKEGLEIDIASLRARSAAHLRAVASDPGVQIKIVR